MCSFGTGPWRSLAFGNPVARPRSSPNTRMRCPALLPSDPADCKRHSPALKSRLYNLKATPAPSIPPARLPANPAHGRHLCRVPRGTVQPRRDLDIGRRRTPYSEVIAVSDPSQRDISCHHDDEPRSPGDRHPTPFGRTRQQAVDLDSRPRRSKDPDRLNTVIPRVSDRLNTKTAQDRNRVQQ